MIKLAGVATLESSLSAVAYAKALERAGFWGLGLADTAPKLYHGVYPAVTASLIETSHLHVGTFVTNPVTRHWAVHASSARGLDELAPGRFFLGMSSGDGAVHSIGLKPAKLADLERYVSDMQALMPVGADTHLIFSGPRGAEVAGRCASNFTAGVGLDAGAVNLMAGRARSARKVAGITEPLSIWAKASVRIIAPGEDREAVRRSVYSQANGASRYTFDFSFDAKNVPDEYQPVLRERLKHYDFAHHAKAGDNPNTHLFDDYPHIQDYLLDRMMFVGTVDECARQLDDLIRETNIAGIWLPIIVPAEGPDRLQMLELCAQAFGPFGGNAYPI